MMVFVLRTDTNEGIRPKLEGKSTFRGFAMKSENSVPLVTQGICDLLGLGEREKNSRLEILIRTNSQL